MKNKKGIEETKKRWERRKGERKSDKVGRSVASTRHIIPRGEAVCRAMRYYRGGRNIIQKIAGVTRSGLVNYRKLPIIIRSVKVFTIVVGTARALLSLSLTLS